MHDRIVSKCKEIKRKLPRIKERISAVVGKFHIAEDNFIISDNTVDATRAYENAFRSASIYVNIRSVNTNEDSTRDSNDSNDKTTQISPTDADDLRMMEMLGISPLTDDMCSVRDDSSMHKVKIYKELGIRGRDSDHNWLDAMPNEFYRNYCKSVSGIICYFVVLGLAKELVSLITQGVIQIKGTPVMHYIVYHCTYHSTRQPEKRTALASKMQFLCYVIDCLDNLGYSTSELLSDYFIIDDKSMIDDNPVVYDTQLIIRTYSTFGTRISFAFQPVHMAQLNGSVEALTFLAKKNVLITSPVLFIPSTNYVLDQQYDGGINAAQISMISMLKSHLIKVPNEFATLERENYIWEGPSGAVPYAKKHINLPPDRNQLMLKFLESFYSPERAKDLTERDITMALNILGLH